MFKTVQLLARDHAGGEIRLHFCLRSTSVAQRWGESLKQANRHSAIRENARFYNFPGHSENSELAIAERIERSIKVINGFFPNLIVGMQPTESVQQGVNRIHLHFADTNLHKKYITEQTSAAWNDLNNALHAYESFLRSRATEKTAGIPESNIVLTWNNPFFQPLLSEDYQYFSVAKKFGTLYVAYCQVGRHLYELFLANDTIAADEHILPLRRLSADTYMWFGSTTGKNSLARREQAIKEWFHLHKERLNELGFQWGDPQLAIGWLPVADIVGSYDDLEDQLKLVKELSKMKEITGLSIET